MEIKSSDLAYGGRLPTRAFGRAFTHIPEHVREDLESLQRESAVYGDHWIDEIGDFRHVRIEFTEEERQEFAHRCWAYELFIRAGNPTWAKETPGIDPRIAHDADSYSPKLKNGMRILPPYHCFAAFLGEHLEALVTNGAGRETVIDLSGREALLFDIRRTIVNLTPVIRSFNNREKGLSPWTVTCEDDVRDLLFVMLRPMIFDISKEEVIPPTAGTHRVVDLCSNAVRVLIELKWINKKGSWKSILKLINDDVQMYGRHPACDDLIVAVVDDVKDIPDPRQFEREMTGVQSIRDRDISIRVIVCDT